MRKNKSHGMNIGTASILLIFTVLSLVSFATLTLISSKADYNLSCNLADRQHAYYDACHKGNAFVAAVNSGYEVNDESGIIRKSIPITDNQSLDIALMQKSRENSDFSENYLITQWQIVNHDDEDYDYSLPVMK